MDEDGSRQNSGERRKYQRVSLALPGQLYDPLSGQTIACTVSSLSIGGAGLECTGDFPAGMQLVLCVDPFGRFEGKAVAYAAGKLALAFGSESKKPSRFSGILRAIKHGAISAGIQRDRRSGANSLARGVIVRENGELLPCDVLDVSMDGVSLRTKTRPPVGEIVNLGRTKGRVVHHGEDGIDVQYVLSEEKAA